MSWRTFYLLAYLATLMAVAYGIPEWVPGIEAQCRAAGYAGSCRDINIVNHELTCSNIWCSTDGTPHSHMSPALSIGPAYDGTRCAMKKVCVAGRCEDLAGRIMPQQSSLFPSRTCMKNPNAQAWGLQ